MQLGYFFNCHITTNTYITYMSIRHSVYKTFQIKYNKKSTCVGGFISFSPSGGRLANCCAEGSAGGELLAISVHK